MRPSWKVFIDDAEDYDRWFDDHKDVYAAQVRLLRAAVPATGRGLEVGVGSGRFAVALGISDGIDPSAPLIGMAQARGIGVVQGVGERLPYRPGSFDYVLMMTVICFLDNPVVVFREIARILLPGGYLIAGFIERDGEIARTYSRERIKGRFLASARFRTAGEVFRFLQDAGFSEITLCQRSRGFCIIRAQT